MTQQTSSNSLKALSNKRLSVQISLTGLSFLVTNSARTETILFSEKTYKQPRTPEELLLDIEFFVSNNLKDVAEYESVTAIYASAEYTAVPASLFDETKASDYLKFNSKILSNDFIAWDHLEHRDLNIVYVPFINVNNYLFDTFGSFQYFHSSSVLLKAIASSKFDDGPKVHVHVRKGYFDLIVQKNGKLVLCNSYPYQTLKTLSITCYFVSNN